MGLFAQLYRNRVVLLDRLVFHLDYLLVELHLTVLLLALCLLLRSPSRLRPFPLLLSFFSLILLVLIFPLALPLFVFFGSSVIVIIDRVDSILAEVDDCNDEEEGEVSKGEEDETSLAVLSG